MPVHPGGIFLACGELACWNLEEIPRHRMFKIRGLFLRKYTGRISSIDEDIPQLVKHRYKVKGRHYSVKRKRTVAIKVEMKLRNE